MFGLDWFMVVLVWSGMSNISFFYENELVWIWFGFEPICRANSPYANPIIPPWACVRALPFATISNFILNFLLSHQPRRS